MLRPQGLQWDLGAALADLGNKLHLFDTVAELVAELAQQSSDGAQLLVMSNGGFDNIFERLRAVLDSGAQ